jgi:pimeloyl-ACP methyl ester carboxylesterase
VSTVALIHGGGGSAWDWHLVVPLLRDRGHDAIAVDLPADVPTATLHDHAQAVVDAVGDREDVVVVAHSLGGFVGPLVCDALGPRARALVLVAGMVPRPGETFSAWWDAVGYADGIAARDAREGPPPPGELETFFHDVDPELAAEELRRGIEPHDGALSAPWPLAAWPAVPTRFVLCRDDRMFPAAWLRGVVRGRLGIDCDELDGGHMPMLARPAELAERLAAYAE